MNNIDDKGFIWYTECAFLWIKLEVFPPISSKGYEMNQMQKEAQFQTVLPEKKPVYEAIKRVLDILVASIALVLVSPVLLIAVIAIRLNSPGKAIYVSDRMTTGGKIFKMFKLRSMYLDAEKRLESLREQNEMKDGPAFKMKNDPRITRVGKFLRKTSIDELPQLINVIKGDMSIVGPRPPLPDEVARYTPYQKQRLGVKQGLTCYWQASGRNNIGFEEWVELDLKYIRERSLWTDFKIVLKTFKAVISMKGAL